MKDDILIFKNPQLGQIRTAGTGDEPMFCLADVCRILDLQTGATKNRLNKKGISLINTPTEGGAQNMTYVNEMNLYKIIMRSDKPQAESFQEWVCGDVLPQIRKTGGYIVTKVDDTPEEIMARALFVAKETLTKREERIKELESISEQQKIEIEVRDTEIKKSASKVNYYDKHLFSVNTQTSTQVAKQINMDAGKLHKKLKEIGIIYHQSGQWLLHSPYSTWGLHSTRTQTFTRSDGSMGSSIYTVWTAKGVRFIIGLKEHEWNLKSTINELKQENNNNA